MRLELLRKIDESLDDKEISPVYLLCIEWTLQIKAPKEWKTNWFATVWTEINESYN